MKKTYIVRVNLDIKGTGEDAKSIRFRSAAAAIANLHKKDNKVVVLSHRGRPDGFEAKLSLKPLKDLLEKSLNRKITLFPDFDFAAIRKKITDSPPGSIFMLENLRFVEGETENSKEFSKQLAGLGDVFINDDFATAHRKNASNVGITKFIRHQIGPNLKREITLLTKAVKNPKKPLVIVIGGAKITDKIGVIKNMEKLSSYILLGGGTANNMLKARGWNIGNSFYDEQGMKTSKMLASNRKIVTPIDLVQEDSKIKDIGPKTIRLYSDIIKKAGTIIWGGPMGVFEDEDYKKGSYDVAKAIAKSKAFSIVGGGETTEVINLLGLGNKIDLLSTGGGAMLEFLSGKKLPAIEALKKK